ncbi:MAG: hypothetical protein J0H12_01815 [Candidatus Paracaedimonas acanthamoebae]|uniref:Uncharacterized protein n=1 Tax=Candidatus Paracaedimonas acanthamoebae TaxID=244581 RepID=A0A8J7PHH5_9PROT|nr:hypothetical protein [Candidatus Paracaedimonas acanthamoebae]
MAQVQKKAVNYNNEEITKPQIEVKKTEKESSSKSKFLKYYAKYMLCMGIVGQSLFYLQAIKIFLTGNAQGVSLSGFTIALFSSISWVIYGHLLKDKILMSVNIIAVLGAILTLAAILWAT